MRKSAPLIVMLGLYAAVLGRGPAGRLLGSAGFDPLAPQPSAAEHLIVAGRFAEARPLVLELRVSHPGEPLVWYWSATIDHHLARWKDEADAWARYVEISAAPGEACPDWPESLARSGDAIGAQAARARCESFARQ